MSGFLHDCCKIELMASRIYQHFATQAHFPERLRTTFQDLAKDEEDHARQFDHALDLPDGALGEVKRIAGEKVLAGLDMVRALFQELQGGSVDPDKALQTALDLEIAFVRIHLDNSCLINDERISSLFTSLARSDEEHLATLRETVIWWKKYRGGQPAVSSV